MTIGQRIQQIREGLGLTRCRAATRAGIQVSHLEKIESGRVQSPTAVTVQRLAQALGVPVQDVLQDPPPPK